MEIKEIPIKSIKVIENSRLKIKDLEGIMQSIKQDGLFNPIRVCVGKEASEYVLVQGHRRLESCRKLGWNRIPAVVTKDIELADLLVLNTNENIHRSELGPIELGRIVNRLMIDFSMTIGEVAKRLGLNNTRISSALTTYKKLPEKYRSKVAYIVGPSNKNGKIPASVVSNIIKLKKSHGLSDSSQEKLLNVSRLEEFGVRDLRIISLFLDSGMTVSQSIESMKEYSTFSLNVIFNNKEIESLLNKYKMDSPSQVIESIIYGEVPPLKRPSFYKSNHIPAKE